MILKGMIIIKVLSRLAKKILMWGLAVGVIPPTATAKGVLDGSSSSTLDKLPPGSVAVVLPWFSRDSPVSTLEYNPLASHLASPLVNPLASPLVSPLANPLVSPFS